MPEPVSFDRRTVLSSSLAASVISIGSPIYAQQAACFSDAHVHLFNCADLPIGGFAKYVMGPAWIGNSAAVEGTIDTIAGLGKRLGRTAESEYRRLGGTAPMMAFHSSPGEMSAEQFGQVAANWIDSRQRPSTSISPTLASSYRQLEAELLADANFSSDVVSKTYSGRPQTGRLAQAVALAARKASAEAPGAWGPGALAQYRARTELSAIPGLAALDGQATRMMGWLYLMTRSRRSHLDSFLEAFSGDERRACTIVSHLVDYDYWLDDHPRSDMLSQIKVMNRLATIAASRGVTLRIFAGFCPLRLAIERHRRVPALFDRMRALASTGAIAGFKLYPPMGFLPLGNAGLPDAAFDTQQAYRKSPLAAWHEAGGGAGLGRALDDALRELYQASLPIMAHARNSLGAGPSYAARAAPAGWEAVVQQYPVRLLLGHLIDGSSVFLDSSDGHDQSWDLAATRRLLTTQHSNGARVFGDLGYIEDLLHNGRGADFFSRLKTFFGPAATRQIVYGSDWIMLAQEDNDRRYVRIIPQAMSDARYSPAEIEGVMHGNLQAFLS